MTVWLVLRFLGGVGLLGVTLMVLGFAAVAGIGLGIAERLLC